MVAVSREQAFGLFQQGRVEESQQMARALLQTDPEDAELWLLDGLAWARKNRFVEAEASLQESIKRDRSYQALLALGQVNVVRKDLQMAEKYLLDAIACAADAIEARRLLGDVYANRGDFEAAVGVYRWLQTHGQADASVHGNLALTLESLRCPDEARHAAEQALALDVNHPVANLVVARLDRAAGRLQAARSRLAAVIAFHPDRPEGASLLTELGHVLDRTGEHAQAFASFQHANAIWQQVVAGAASAKRIYLDRIRFNEEFYVADRAERGAEVAGANLIFLIGFPRSGTTLIEEIINTRPNVVTTQEEPLITDLIMELTAGQVDPDAYRAAMIALNEPRLAQLRVRYFEALRRVTHTDQPSPVYVDKLPLNIIEVGLIHRLFPAARFLVALRDPRDVCLSCFMQSFSLNPAMIHFLDIEDTAHFYAATMNLWIHYKRAVGDLRYLEYRYEDLVSDFESVSRKVLKFIGAEWTADIETFHEQASGRVVRTPSYIDVASPLYSRAIGRWRHYAAELEPARNTLSPFVEQFGYAD